MIPAGPSSSPLGQPGTAASSYSATPVVVPGLTGVKAIAAGWFHACALLDDGNVACWGDNSSGQLGDGTQSSSPTPVTVSDLGHAIAIATTAYSTCAVIVDGSLQCWGVDLERLMPSAVPGVSGTIAVSVAELSTCAVVTGGEPKMREAEARRAAAPARSGRRAQRRLMPRRVIAL